MTELDRIDNSDKFNFRRVPSCLQVCEKRSQATRKKKMKSLHIDGSASYLYSKRLGVRLPVCPVNKNIILMLIKVWVVYIK